MTVWVMHFACGEGNAINTHLGDEYVFKFLSQTLLFEQALLLRYTQFILFIMCFVGGKFCNGRLPFYRSYTVCVCLILYA